MGQDNRASQITENSAHYPAFASAATAMGNGNSIKVDIYEGENENSERLLN
jgi:hypothetical protein